jgi:toxin CptA
MSKSRRSSIASAPCRLEWRPSRQVGAALWLLAMLTPFCLVASDLPRGWAWSLSAIAGLAGIRDAWRYRHQPSRQLLIPAGRGAPTCDAERIEHLLVHWRGPLAFLRWRDGSGRNRRCVFAPDTLPAPARRELKLAMQRREAAAGSPSMAG